jgi:hypothetical protein
MMHPVIIPTRLEIIPTRLEIIPIHLEIHTTTITIMYPMTNATNHSTTIPTADATAGMGETEEMDATVEMAGMGETARMLAALVNTVEDLRGQSAPVDVTGIPGILDLLVLPDHRVK